MNDTWKIAPEGLEISADHVDVWLASTDPGELQIRAYKALLSPAELERLEKFRVEFKHREYIVSRGLLRRVMTKMTGLDVAGVDFDYGEHGKPSLPGRAESGSAAFNVSHSHGLALVALTLGGRLGVDLEKIRPKVEWRSLAEHYFSEAEIRALDGYSDEAGLKAFFTCWTRKEAFVKALGGGISYGLKEFDVSIDPDEARAALTIRAEDEDASRWLIKNLPVPASHVAALALDRSACELRLWRADPLVVPAKAGIQ